MSDEEQRKKFAMIIADIIQDLLRDSDDLSTILEEVNKEGYDVLLTISSGILIRRREDKEEEEKPLPAHFEFSQSDKEFLQSIGITIPEEEL